jgi:hypothetical protein
MIALLIVLGVIVLLLTGCFAMLGAINAKISGYGPPGSAE